jgi:hypothetical protein
MSNPFITGYTHTTHTHNKSPSHLGPDHNRPIIRAGCKLGPRRIVANPPHLVCMVLARVDTLPLRKVPDANPLVAAPRDALTSRRAAINNFRIQVSDDRFQVSGFKFQMTGFRFQVSGFRFQVSDDRLLCRIGVVVIA